MPESLLHQQLVQVLEKEISAFVPSDCLGLIQIDSPSTLNLPPKTAEGYRPDAYYQFEDLLIIGEAKASDDIEKQHSRAQYESYLRECSRFCGRAVFILSVPFLDQASANNILYNLKKKIPGDYHFVVKGWLGGSV